MLQSPIIISSLINDHINNNIQLKTKTIYWQQKEGLVKI